MAFKMKYGAGENFDYGEGTGSSQKWKGKAALKAASRIGMKFIPGLNIASTLYDVGSYAWKNRDKIVKNVKKVADKVKKK
tara:strand:+ start:368 stop:607 length:240 start_codon:yes stop_codon:yes gene_type:complete